ncbi:MAG: diguanylate cyclase, partial [Candidatus Omnitrophica bacterium]|nr:diguanylate cyclase [Candidatus Omnitrophota bacterium]
MPIRGMEDKRELDREKLKTMAFMDDLTGLYNRRFLYKYLPTELGDVKQLGKPLCMFMMDVDNFKGINDSYGHLCGDSVLSEIGRILQKSFRGGDSVIRYAGDEFIAVLPGASREDALNIAKRIIEKVDKNHFSDPESKTSIHVTVSIGIALYPQDAQDPEKLLRQADRALYSSKRSGRNRFSTVSDITEEVLDESKLQELFPCPKLISRGPELDQLKKYLDEAEKGKSNFILIAGERGMGKTRLLDEFKKYAQLKGITTIGASCSPEIAEQPYQTLIGALENLFISLGPQVRE